MQPSVSIYKGCLLGMAVGDAMGATVDKKSYSEICESYGPAGLLGYDLVNGMAEISSYTQIAAYVCNALLLATARGQKGTAAYMGWISKALKEWARVQHLPGAPERRNCWLSHVSRMRSRRCMDARTLDALTRDVLGTPKEPANQGAGPGTLTAAIPVGLFYHPEKMQFGEIGQVGAQTVALTHGEPMAFLSGAVLAYAVAGIVQAPNCPMEEQFLQAAQAVEMQYGSSFPQVQRLQKLVQDTIALAKDPQLHPVRAMEHLACGTASQVLAGAIYAVLASGEDFDNAMIIAVNHSGKSAAVGAITGALLGAKFGEESLPDFYLECLDTVQTLRELAGDLCAACPKGWHTRLFDDDWDRKYTYGKPVDREGWAEV